MQSLNDLLRLVLANQEAEIVGTGAVADHANVDVIDGFKHTATGTTDFTHPITDECDQCQIMFHLNLAQSTEFGEDFIAEYGFAAGLAAGVVQGQRHADFGGGDEIDRDAVARQNAEYVGQETAGAEHVRALQGQQHLIATQSHGAEQRG